MDLRAKHAEPPPAWVDIPGTFSHPEVGMPAPPISAFWLIVPCLACDFLMVPALSVMTSGPPREFPVATGFGIVGCVLAQGCLLAAFLAWSDGPFLWRLLMHWLIAAGLYLIWLVGLVVAPPDPAAPQIAATVVLGVPLVSIAAQFPLWLARQFWGWRLVCGADIPVCHPAEAGKNVCPVPASETADRKLAIRDLMLATLLVAVSLALARVAPAPDGKDKDVWPVWAFSCVVASVISSITMLPAGALLMRTRQIRRGLAWSIVYASAWIALVWIIATVQWWFALPRAPRAIYVGISSFMFTFASTLILSALIARSHGYRLTGGSLRHRPFCDRRLPCETTKRT